MARAVANDNPPPAIGTARKILEINPSHVEAHLFLAGQAADAGKRDEARQLLQKALAVNPSSLDAHSLLAALAYVEDKTPEFEAEVAKVLAISPDYGEVYRVAGGIHGARLPVRRGGGARRGARSRSPRGTRRRSPISACTCCAPATRAARARRSKPPSS